MLTRSLPARVPVLVLLLSASLAAQGGRTSLVSVHVGDAAAMQRLLALDVDVAPCVPSLGDVEIILHDPSEASILSAAGFTVTWIHTDFDAWIRAGLETPAPDTFPAIGSGSMGGYFTFDEMVAAFDALQTAWPALVAPKVSLGLTIEGRNLWMWKVSDNVLVDENEPEIELDAMHHAREPGGMTNLYYFLLTILEGYGTNPESTNLVDNREIYCIPCVNPDGYVYNQTTNPAGGGMWRKNRRNNGNGTFGVDLNRNYGYQWGIDNTGSSSNSGSDTYRGPAPFSEPETQALQAFGLARNFTVANNVHTYSCFHLYPFGYAASVPSPFQAGYLEWGNRMSERNGYVTGTVPQLLYLANGGSTDWWEAVLGVRAVTTEMGSINDSFWPPTARILPIAEDNFPTFYEWCWYGGSHVVVKNWTLVEVSGNGNPWPESGETFDIIVTLRNLGVLSTSGLVTSVATATGPFVQIVNGLSATGGPIASLSDQNVTFRFAVTAPVPVAAPVTIDLSTTFDGIARAETIRLFAGVPVTVSSHTFESDEGWTAGAPGDFGSGAWVRTDPTATSLTLAGTAYTWNPENDHTAAPGAQCWVTGNAASGSSANAADVDGITTLTSPVFDLGNVLEPTATFWIWFANDDVDDACTVEVSNDAGASWVKALEIRGRRNSWNQRTIRIADHLVPTSATQVRFRVTDNPNNSATECALDDFAIEGFPASLDLSTTAIGGPGGTIQFALAAPATPGIAYGLGISESALLGIPLPDGRRIGVDATPLLYAVPALPEVFVDFAGVLDGSGLAAPRIDLPAVPALSGFAFQMAGVSFTSAIPFTAFDLTGTRRVQIP